MGQRHRETPYPMLYCCAKESLLIEAIVFLHGLDSVCISV